MRFTHIRIATLICSVVVLTYAWHGEPAVQATDPAAPFAETETPDETAPKEPVTETDPPEQGEDEKEAVAPKMSPPKGLKRIHPDAEVWIDTKNKLVVVDGNVVLREGQLEMFACPRKSKEHESVVAVNSKAFLVHTALLAVGASEGTPVEWDPEYKPASGTEVDVKVLWLDVDGKQHKTDAKNWVRNVKTKKALEYNWVFAGSGFWKDDFDGKMHYLAEAGDLICVSNFPSATLDLPIESSQANTGLVYEAFTDNIPPRGTPIRLVLIPKLEKEKEKSAEQTESDGDQ